MMMASMMSISVVNKELGDGFLFNMGLNDNPFQNLLILTVCLCLVCFGMICFECCVTFVLLYFVLCCIFSLCCDVLCELQNTCNLRKTL